MENFSYLTPEERFRTAETELNISKEVLEGQEKPGDTPEKELNTTPEMDPKEVTSHAMEEQSERSENLTDEMSLYYQSNEEDPEMSDSDDPNLSGLSHLEPDPSLGCFPRRFAKQRSTTWTYEAPDEPPQERAWNYLMRRNIIELLEEMTAEIFFHRFSSPIDYMIEATERARLKNQEEQRSAEERRTKKRIGKDGDVDSTSTVSMDVKDRSGATTETGLILFPSQGDYINDVILVPTQADVSAHAPHDETAGDVTSFGGKKKDTGKKEEDRWSTMTMVSNHDDDDDDTGGITCFPVDASLQVELEREVKEDDVNSLASDESNQSPRQISSTEALKLLSYLS